MRKESVAIVYNGDDLVNMRGWTLRDRDGHVFRFPDYRVLPGSFVYVRTGSGNDHGPHM